MLSAFDDLPVHQVPEPVRQVGTSDRNFYDRYYFNAHACTDQIFLTAGMGQYPNLGVADAFLAVTRGERQTVVRASRELEDRADLTVGPFSIEVIEGLRRLRLRVEGEEIGADLTWEGAVPAYREPRHVNRHGARVTTDSARFAQTGFWSGRLDMGGETLSVEPREWWGGRDRSWGIRPVGEREPAGRPRTEGGGGFLWIYSTMQVPEFTIVTIVQEDRYGRRSLEEAVRLWPFGVDRDPEPLGVPDHALEFSPGTREVSRAVMTFRAGAGLDHGTGSVTTVEVTPLTASWLSLGTGYGTEPGWAHGMYQGALVVQSREYELAGPDASSRRYGLVDHLARFETDGAVGYGLFETAVLGPNERYGFGSRR